MLFRRFCRAHAYDTCSASRNFVRVTHTSVGNLTFGRTELMRPMARQLSCCKVY